VDRIGCLNVAGDSTASGRFNFVRQMKAEGPDEVCLRQLWMLELVSLTVILDCRWLLLSHAEKYLQASSQIILYHFFGKRHNFQICVASYKPSFLFPLYHSVHMTCVAASCSITLFLCLSQQPTSSTPQREDVYPSRGVSPRRLIKQAALDSPPPHLQGDTEELHTSFYRAVHYDRKPPTGM
jgi:hypothetical protein